MWAGNISPLFCLWERLAGAIGGGTIAAMCARLALRRGGAYNPPTLGVAVSEADTCRTYVVPKLYAAGWTDEQIREQVTFTDGRIVPAGNSHARKAGKRADYVLRYRADLALAVVEAKAEYKTAGAGLQQAMDYAETLGLRFASTLGTVACVSSRCSRGSAGISTRAAEAAGGARCAEVRSWR